MGVIAIIVISSQVETARQTVLSTLETLGPNTLIVIPHGRMPLSDADVNNIRTMNGVSDVIPFLTIKGVMPGLEEPSATIMGVSSLGLSELLGNVRLIEGSLYYDVPAPQAVVGYDIATNYGSSEPIKIGQPLVVYFGKGRSLTLNVVGILDYYGTRNVVETDSTVFVPIEYFKTLVKGVGYNGIIVKALSTDYIDTLQQTIQQVFGRRVQVISVKQIATAVSNVMGQFNMLLIGVASTAFVAAGLGTFNIMMVSVLEHVREIGILKAIGMKNSSVLTLYMIQGLLIGIIGALIGVALGVAGSYVVHYTSGSNRLIGLPNRPPGARRGISFGGGGVLSLNITYIGLAVLISVLTALISTAYPAWRASKLSPIEALRYE